MYLTKRRQGSQRPAKAIEISPLFDHGDNSIYFLSKDEPKTYYIITPENESEFKELLSVVHKAYNNFD